MQGILFILVIGAATDYSLLYVSRYREALRDNQKRWDATLAAFRGAFPPIIASAGTVILGLLCLLLSDLNSNKALGPVGAIGIAFALIAALTMLPALLLAFGRAAFWPLRPKFGSDASAGRRRDRQGAVAAARPRDLAASALGLGRVRGRCCSRASAGLLQLKANGTPQSAVVEGYSQARDGQTALGKHFPQGSGSPAVIVADEGIAAGCRRRRRSTRRASIGDGALDRPRPRAATRSRGRASSRSSRACPLGSPTVKDGKVMLQATLVEGSRTRSPRRRIVEKLRTNVADTGDAIVGGTTATTIDTNAAAVHDRDLIIPVVLLVILIVLMLLLRSIVAPLLLIGSVVLSFSATLGISALVFNHVFDFVGADPAGAALRVHLPGGARGRLQHLPDDAGARGVAAARHEDGVIRGLVITGGVITSAGIVLAATFAALGVIPVLFLSQIAFIVGFGVLLDTIVVRSLLVPALSYDIGRAIWWPSGSPAPIAN